MPSESFSRFEDLLTDDYRVVRGQPDAAYSTTRDPSSSGQYPGRESMAGVALDRLVRGYQTLRAHTATVYDGNLRRGPVDKLALQGSGFREERAAAHQDAPCLYRNTMNPKSTRSDSTHGERSGLEVGLEERGPYRLSGLPCRVHSIR